MGNYGSNMKKRGGKRIPQHQNRPQAQILRDTRFALSLDAAQEFFIAKLTLSESSLA